MRRCGDVEKCPLALEIWSSVDEFPNEVKIGKRWQQITEVGKMGTTLWKMTKASNENWTTVTTKSEKLPKNDEIFAKLTTYQNICHVFISVAQYSAQITALRK